VDTKSLPVIKLIQGENIEASANKILFVDPKQGVAEGHLYITNFKICFHGIPFDSLLSDVFLSFFFLNVLFISCSKKKKNHF